MAKKHHTDTVNGTNQGLQSFWRYALTALKSALSVPLIPICLVFTLYRGKGLLRYNSYRHWQDDFAKFRVSRSTAIQLASQFLNIKSTGNSKSDSYPKINSKSFQFLSQLLAILVLYFLSHRCIKTLKFGNQVLNSLWQYRIKCTANGTISELVRDSWPGASKSYSYLHHNQNIPNSLTFLD
jgi:hypothetical protein